MKKNTRQLQKERTREFLISTASELFAARGILATRMSDIAQAAGVSHGTVFLHFETQEALVKEVIRVYCGKMVLLTHELARNCGSLHHLLQAHLQGIMEFEALYSRLVIENRLLPQEARDEWINLQSALALHFSQAAERELEEKTQDIPLSMLFNMWIGLVHHYLSNDDLFAPGQSVLGRWGDTLVETFTQLLLKK